MYLEVSHEIHPHQAYTSRDGGAGGGGRCSITVSRNDLDWAITREAVRLEVVKYSGSGLNTRIHLPTSFGHSGPNTARLRRFCCTTEKHAEPVRAGGGGQSVVGRN